MTGVPALEAVDLSFGYPEHAVGQHVSLIVQWGDVLCLLGPNGCGKTTLFKTLLGLLPAQGGDVLLNGSRVAKLVRGEIARRIAYVPQTQAVAFPYTAIDLVLMGRVSHRGPFASPSREDRHLSYAALEQLGIKHLSDRDMTRLSGGQRQLVLIARALAQASPLIVMDEPTASLDFGNQVVVLREIKRLAATGVGIILSTHDPDHAFSVATRVAMMRQGQIIASGLPDDVMTAERLRTVYSIDVTVEQMPSGQRVCVPSIV